jgi:hypothetical protein
MLKPDTAELKRGARETGPCCFWREGGIACD